MTNTADFGITPRTREIGRIKFGKKIAATASDGSQYMKPTSVETWIFSSGDKGAIERVASIYGGRVVEGEEGFDVETPAGEFTAWLAPRPFSKRWEMWNKSGLLRACDNVTQKDGSPCQCPAAGPKRIEAAKGKNPSACKPYGRISLVLPEIDMAGTWLLVTHDYAAIGEIDGAIATAAQLAECSGATGPIQVSLRLEKRGRYDVVTPTLSVVPGGALQLGHRPVGTSAGDPVVPGEPRESTAPRVEKASRGEADTEAKCAPATERRPQDSRAHPAFGTAASRPGPPARAGQSRSTRVDTASHGDASVATVKSDAVAPVVSITGARAQDDKAAEDAAQPVGEPVPPPERGGLHLVGSVERAARRAGLDDAALDALARDITGEELARLGNPGQANELLAAIRALGSASSQLAKASVKEGPLPGAASTSTSSSRAPSGSSRPPARTAGRQQAKPPADPSPAPVTPREGEQQPPSPGLVSSLGTGRDLSGGQRAAKARITSRGERAS